MKTIFLSSCLLLTVLRLIAQVQSGEEVVIDRKVAHDLYVAAGKVTINAPVDGDLIVAGGTVVVNDTVTQDILVTGGKILLSGVAGDDVRCGGGTVELGGILSGDFVVAGGKVSVLRNAVVSGNLLSSGGDVTLEGKVKGDVSNASGTFTLNGIAERNLMCKGGKIIINGAVDGDAELAAEVIELGSDAKFGKDVRYWNKDRSLDFKNSLKGGHATFDPGLEIEDGKWHYLGFASFVVLSWYLGTAIVMLLLIQYLFSLTLKNAANTIKSNSMKSLGAGLLFILGVPVAIVITFITLIGVPLALLTLVAYITCILLATVVVALLISNWINNTFYQSSWKNGRIVAAAFGIFIFLKLASLTPFTGPLVMFLLVCMAFGGLLLNVKWRRKNKALELT